MNSSAFSPTQFAGAAYSYSSTTTFYEGIASSCASPSYADVFVDPQWSTWSQTQAIPFGWSYSDSEPSSVSHGERCENFELAYPNALPHKLFAPIPSSDVSILPGIGCTLAPNSSDSPSAHSPPYGSECVLSVQYDAYNPPMPQPAPVPSAYSLARVVIAAPSIASALVETFIHSEHNSGQADEEIDISTHAVSQDVPRTQPSHRTYSRASSYSSSSYHSSSPEPYPQPSSELIACRRRNAPAPRSTAISSDRWKCPHCTHVQRNRRSPDLKRHIETHTRGADVADWVCCGVPLDNAAELGVPAAVLRAAPVFDFEGVLMIGGCRKTFSRRDALKRHLKARNETCYGDPLGLYQPRNRELEDRA